MRAGKLRQLLLIASQIIALVTILSICAPAQSPGPSPSPAPASSPSASGKTFSENLAALAIRAAEIIPVLQFEVESPLLNWFEKISLVLAAIIVMFSFARLWRENAGAGADVFWWFGRLAVCFALLGSGPYLINYLNSIGQQIAAGNESIGESALAKFYRTQRESFDRSYIKFSDGLFTVKVNGQDVPVKPGTGGTEAVVGVLYDKESSIKDVERKLDISSWNMPLLFSVLNFARGIIDFGDFYLMLLGSFLLIAVRLAAPLMIAVAIDRSLANKVSYPFVWGVIVLTLVWPVVSYLIRALAYMGGNVAMALGDEKPLYTWDPATMQVITSSLSQPVYTIVIAAAIMIVAGLLLWMSPVIAYQISMGKVYEGVSTTVSGWVGALVGAGVELYSAQMAAAITNQAERVQAQGTYAAEVTRAESGFEAGNLGVRARQIAAIASAHGGQIASLGQIYGARTQAIMTAQAGMLFGVNSTSAATSLSKGDIQVRTAQNIADLNVNRDQQSANLETNRAADTQYWVGSKVMTGADWLGGAARTALADRNGKQTLSGRAVGSVIELGGAAYGLSQQYGSIQNRAEGQQLSLNRATEGLIGNQTRAAQGQSANQDVYLRQMTEAHQKYAQGQISAANAGAGQATAGVNRGTAVTIGGVNQATALERQANRVIFDGSVKAATQARDSAFEAARLRALASVISAVGHNVARDVEYGLTLRY